MSVDSDELRYSVEANATRSVLYQGLNDINLFVEDADRQYEYETIFKRMLGDQYSIRTIFPLGGKLSVKEKYVEFGSETDGIKNFYIVDGDFDRYIHQSDMVEADCFIYLETYNIENYYIDENACLCFAKGRLKCVDAVVCDKVAFCQWKQRIVSEAKELFLYYCLVQKYYPHIPNVNRKHYTFIDQSTGFERTDIDYRSFKSEIDALDLDSEQKIGKIKEIYEQINGLDYFNLICGKFLLTSLACYLRKVIGMRIDNDDLKWSLTTNFDISKLDYVKMRILK